MPRKIREIQAPIVHLNGTSKEYLQEQIEAAYSALNAAYDVLKKTAPNGRDYYPLGPDAMKRAQDQHTNRLIRISNTLTELETIQTLIEKNEFEGWTEYKEETWEPQKD